MKVSIVVPAYNEEESIEKSLSSLKNQDYNDYELLVVDNNSKDKTNEISKKFADKVFLELKQGYIHAVNRGASEAKGELITFCDADSIYPKNWLTQIVNEFDKHPEAVAVYGTADTHDAGKVKNFTNGLLYTSFLRISRVFGLDNTSGFNFVMKKETFDKVGGYDPKFQKMSPDIELGKRMKAEGKIRLNTSIKVSSSFRRYQQDGQINTQIMFLKSWWAMVRGKEPNVSYEEYNKINEDKK